MQSLVTQTRSKDEGEESTERAIVAHPNPDRELLEAVQLPRTIQLIIPPGFAGLAETINPVLLNTAIDRLELLITDVLERLVRLTQESSSPTAKTSFTQEQLTEFMQRILVQDASLDNAMSTLHIQSFDEKFLLWLTIYHSIGYR